jgi:hypothetical protein
MYRQPKRKDWISVFERVAVDLAQVVSGAMKP